MKKIKKTPLTFPWILQTCLDNGWIRREGDEYIGFASDGAEVLIGNHFDIESIEKYLTFHPTPDTW